MIPSPPGAPLDVIAAADPGPPRFRPPECALHGQSRGGPLTEQKRQFPQPGDPEWLRVVVSQSSPMARPGTPPPPLPGPEEGYRALAAITPDPVVVVDAALRISSVNDAFLALIGEPDRERMLGRSILLSLVEWERVRAANLVARFLETGIWDIAELTGLQPDGTLVPIEARCEMLRDGEGRFAGMLVLVRDLTRREMAEDPLRAIVAGTSRATGGEYFQSLTQHLAQIFSVRIAMVAELDGPAATEARSIAYWRGDAFAPSLTYALAGTPCERVGAGETCYFPEGVQRLFPRDEWLGEVDAQGYLGAPLTDSSGRVIGLLVVVDTAPLYRSRDMGSILRIFAARAAAELERLRIEAALRLSEERLAAAVRGSRDGLLDADLRTGKVYCSPRFFEITGFQGHESELDLSLEGLLARVHPDDAEETRAILTRCLTEGTPFQHGCRWRTRSGEYRWFESRLDARIGSNGVAARLSGFVSDLTDHRREALLAEQTGGLALMGGWELDLTTGRLYWTAGTYHLHAVSPASFVPTLDAALDFYAPESRPVIRTLMERAQATGEPWDQVLQLDSARGERLWVRVLGRAEFDRGRPVRLFGALQDVSAQRRLEEQLLQSQKLEGIGRLAGGIAHDFNNLLTAILGNAELALASLPPEHGVREDLEQIRRAAASAGTLTAQLLAFARRQMVTPRVVDLGALLDEVRPMLERMGGDAVALTLAYPDGLWPVTIDPGPLEQVLVNLVINARDAMPGGGEVTISVTNLAADQVAALGRPEVREADWVHLAVTDTGPGFTAEVLPLVFEPFFTTKPRGKGTGLGLATCHGIIHQAGGHVWAGNAPSGGAVIHCLLPRSENPPPVPEPVGEAPAARIGSETILLVEDEPAVRDLARRVLLSLGYQVLEADSGRAALDAAASHAGAIDLVVSDVLLPGLSGPEALRLLREQRPGLRAVLMSGYADREVVAEEVLDPDTEFLAKPFTPAMLAAKVREALDRQPSVTARDPA